MNTTHAKQLHIIFSICLLLSLISSGCNIPSGTPPTPVVITEIAPQASPTMAAISNKPQVKTFSSGNQKNTPVVTPTEKAPPVSRRYEHFDGISFYYVSSSTKKVTSKIIEASSAGSKNVNPKMDQFEFQDYAITSQISPRIYVFSIQEYVDLGGDAINKQVKRLKQLIANQPADPSGELPLLLGEPTTQLFHTQLKYMKFQNGQGIRYVTEYNGKPWPVDNKLLFYTFQGITDDGNFYVSATLPVNHPKLAGDNGEIQMKQDAAKFEANYSEYVSDMEKSLNAQKVNSFTPNLVLLDAMIRSMVIDKKTASVAAEQPTAKPAADESSAPTACTNEAAFVADITIPDDTSFQLGTPFLKTWRLQNIGTCTWSPEYQLVFVSGDAMGAPDSISMTSDNIPPNGNLDVSISMTTPDNPGTYQGYYKLRAPDGTIFGIEPNGSNAFWVLINAVDNNSPDEEESAPPEDVPVNPPLHINPPNKPIITVVIPPFLLAAKPDLVFTQVMILGAVHTSTGGTVHVTISIKNQGDGDATGDFLVRLFPNTIPIQSPPTPFCDKTFNGLAAHQEVTYACDFTYLPNSTQIRARTSVDAANTIVESDESNNDVYNDLNVSP
jgi:hypothetical protein